MLSQTITEHLGSDDDPKFWSLAVDTILKDAVFASQQTDDVIFAEIGCCRHWIRPHQSRWVDEGGFAWPFGYDKTTTGYSFRALPAFEWSVQLRLKGFEWTTEHFGGRCLRLRVALPGRTTRHLQAAVHTIWQPRLPSSKHKSIQLYGFRKKCDLWQLTATRILGAPLNE